MASTVQTGGGSGVDLSELTSGELFFLHLLKYNYGKTTIFGSDHCLIAGKDNPLYGDSDCGVRVDMSKIASVTCTDYFGTMTTNVINGDNVNSRIATGGWVNVASFTTTDGKVHTASNLNY